MPRPCQGFVAGEDPRPHQLIESKSPEPCIGADPHFAPIERASSSGFETVDEPQHGQAEYVVADDRHPRIDALHVDCHIEEIARIALKCLANMQFGARSNASARWPLHDSV